MFRKLLKHEYIYIFKSFAPIYGIYLALTLVFKLLITLDCNSSVSDNSTTFDVAFYIVAITFYLFTFILALLTISNNVKRFKDNMFSHEGYLTNTLPVTPNQHILAKLIAGASNYLASFFVILMAINILLIGLSDFRILNKAIANVAKDTVTKHFSEFISFLLCSVAVYCAFMLFCYMVSSITSVIGGKKAVGAGIVILAFFANIFIISMISDITLSIVKSMSDCSYEFETIITFLLYAAVYSVIAVIEFLITANNIKKHLNLQ